MELAKGFNERFSGPATRLNADISTNLDDSIVEVRGHFRIDVWEGQAFEGRLVETPVDDKNLVVTLARKTMSRLVAGAAGTATITKTSGTTDVSGHPEYLYITRMKWGTGGHNPSDPTQPLTPSVSDEDLAAAISSPAYKAVTVDYPSDTSVRFTATLDQTEANGVGLSEEGLFCEGDGTTDFLFARKCFGLLTKTADFSFSFAHTILF